MSWKDPFVRAGVACPAYIKEKTGVYPEVFIRYRKPDSVAIEMQHKDFTSCASDPAKLVSSMRLFVAKHLTMWSFNCNPDETHINQLTHPLLLRMYFTIMQSDPSDEIPSEWLHEGETGTLEGEQKK
jgi:hypothetical protein